MGNTITGLVTRVIRHGHTVYGNPIISVELSTPTVGFDGRTVLRISDNASLVYGIENSEYRDEPHVFALTRSGRISHSLGVSA